jgi:hypothetical protein
MFSDEEAGSKKKKKIAVKRLNLVAELTQDES